MSRSRQRLVAATMALSLSAALVSSAAAAPLARRHFTTNSQVTASGLPRQVLEKVIARGGKSKNYSDLIPLDGGTVGIAHFAVGGLAALYREMDTLKYFKRSQLVMIRDFSAKCRPPGKTGNDSGWGCFSQPWWHQGMKSFVLSTESKSVQNRAWAEMMRPVIAKALSKGWTSDRSLAIALGIANSLGTSGFTSLATKAGWQPEQTLSDYVGKNKHRKRRQDAINKVFPM